MNLLKILSKIDKNILEIISKSLSSVFIRVIGLFFGLILSIYIGKNYGAETVGIFSISTKIQEFLIIFGLFGVGEILMKEVAIRNNNLFIQNSFIIVFIFSSILLLLFYNSIELISFYIFKNPDLSKYLKIFTLIAFFKIHISFVSQILKGLKFTWQANAIKDSFPITLLIIFGFFLTLLGYEINFYSICAGLAVSHLLVLIISFIFLNRKTQNIYVFKSLNLNLQKKIIKESFPLLIVSSFVLINSFIDVVMLTIYSSMEQVGLYSVSSRIAFLINFFVIMSGTILAPKIAKFYSEKNLEKLKQTISFTSKSYLLIATITLAVYLLFGSNVLSFWGEEFSKSYSLLLILSVGYVFNLIFGLSTFMLSMTNNQKLLGRISVFFGTFNIILNFILIKSYGAVGAATATSITLILENITKAYFVKKHLKLSPIMYTNNNE